MNRTHLEHAVIALVIQLALMGFIGAWHAGGLAVALFLGREIAQHEYKLGVERGWQWGQTLPVKWWEGVIRGWTRDSAFDLLAPALICAALALAATALGLP